jgi:hypothetical protein
MLTLRFKFSEVAQEDASHSLLSSPALQTPGNGLRRAKWGYQWAM